MRYFLTERVYYHHTKVVAGAMISKAVELAMDHGKLDEADLLSLGDWTLFEHLRRVRVPAIAGLMDRLEQRRLLKRAYVISAATVDAGSRLTLVARYHESRATRSETEVTLADEAGCDAEDVVIYCPALTLMKEADALVETPNGVGPMSDAAGAGVSEIKALAERHASLWRLYVFVPPEQVEAMREIATRHFGYSSEYR
jgi:HD superfamily phosphohydrolase